jgi:Domain of unknown function (DUF3885)
MIANEFGSAWCGPGPFYAYSKALRFELAVGETRLERFLSAHDRSLTVLRNVFRGAQDLHLATEIYIYSEKPSVPSLLRAFRALRDCDLPQPVRGAIATSAVTDEDDMWQCIMVSPLRHAELPRALWAAVGHDLGIEPRLSARVYIMSRDTGVLAHPYDDRGMDLIGPNTTKLKEIYDRYRSWLLDYDLDVMDKAFGASESGEGSSEA